MTCLCLKYVFKLYFTEIVSDFSQFLIINALMLIILESNQRYHLGKKLGFWSLVVACQLYALGVAIRIYKELVQGDALNVYNSQEW